MCNENVECDIEDDAMDNMINVLVENVLPDDINPKRKTIKGAKEEHIRSELCKQPLFPRDKVSKLRALLSVLNL